MQGDGARYIDYFFMMLNWTLSFTYLDFPSKELFKFDVVWILWRSTLREDWLLGRKSTCQKKEDLLLSKALSIYQSSTCPYLSFSGEKGSPGGKFHWVNWTRAC